MAQWKDYSKKTHLGSVDWRLAKDWKLLYWGDIFSIPTTELKKYNWGEISFGVEVEIPVQRIEFDPSIKGQNNKVYYTVIIDWDYLLERQATLFGSLGWAKEEINNFLTQQIDWLDRRSQELEKVQKERAILEAAQQMSDLTGQPLQYWVDKIKEAETQIEDSTPIETKKEPTHKGIIKKLGNEFFIKNDQGLWKIGTTEKYSTELSDVIPEQAIESEYYFEPDMDTKPPSSRKAKGWVKEIIVHW